MHHRKFGSLAVAGLLSSTLIACTTINPYTGEEQTSKAATGAAIGAAAGAAAGAVAGSSDDIERKKAMLIGAGVGALAGAGVGYYMDVQEAKLRQQLQGTGVSVTRMGDNIILNMPGNVTFATDSSDLRPDFFPVLDSVGLVLQEYEKTVIEVAGHTDSTGSHQYNQALSERRAATVANYIEGRGVVPMRVLVVGMGEERPIAGNDTAEGRQMNRRVELTLVPLTS